MLADLKVYHVLHQALQRCGAISYDEPIDASLGKTALIELNALRSEWSGTHINPQVYDYIVEMDNTYDHVTLGTLAYDSSIYTNGVSFYSDPNFTTEVFAPKGYKYVAVGSKVRVDGMFPERPAIITDVVLRCGNINIPLQVKSLAEYRQISIPNITSLPSTAFISNGYPIQEVYLFPQIQQGQSLRIYGKKYLKEYEHVNESYVDLPELFTPLVTNLTLRLCDVLGKEVKQSFVISASSSTKHLKINNTLIDMRHIKNDFSGGGQGFNFFAGI